MDDIQVTPGSGVTIAADDVGGKLYQRVKLGIGADGAAADFEGKVGSVTYISEVTFTLSTTQHAAGDVLAETQVISVAHHVVDGKSILVDMMLLDKSDQGQPLIAIFLDANVSLGVENSAPTISDADAEHILGAVAVNSSDWIDLGGCQVASVPVGILIQTVSGTNNLYVALLSQGTGTYAASGLYGRFKWLEM